MAKGVGSLLGRADATLVSAATRASLAAVPKDLSKIHERTAAAYASMARTTGAVYGKALEVIGKVGGELIQNAKTSKLEPPQWTNTAFEEKPKSIVLEEDSAQGREYATPDTKELDPPGAINIPGAGDAYKAPEIPSSVTSAPGYTYTDNNGNTEPITIQTTTEKLDDLRRELKNVKKLGLDRKGRKAEKNRIRGVMDMIRSENVAFGAFKENMTTMLDQDLINFEASGVYGMDKMLFSRAMLASGKPVKQTDPNLAAYDGARAIQGYDKSGKMVFTYVNKYGVPFKNKDGSNMTIDKSAIVSGDFFVPKSEKRPVFDGLINRDFIKKNYKYGSRNFDNVIEKGIDENITDKNTALDAYYYRFDNTNGSLSAALNNVEYNNEGVPQIKETEMSGMLIGALQGISNKDQFDVSGDGVFDEKDYATQENYAALVKKALSGDDIQLGKSLLKAHLKNNTQILIEEFKAQEPTVTTRTSITKTPKEEKIDLGVSRLSNQRLYATRQDIKTKYDQIINAKSGDSVEGWDGKRTYRYTYNVPTLGKAGTWRYQVWDADREQFVTKGGSEKAAGGGGGVKSYNTNDVIGELIPQTMLTSSIDNNKI